MTPAVKATTRTVYQAGQGFEHDNIEDAYRDASYQLMQAKPEPRAFARWMKLRNRLARWLRWRDERAVVLAAEAETARLAGPRCGNCKHFKGTGLVANGREPMFLTGTCKMLQRRRNEVDENHGCERFEVRT